VTFLAPHEARQKREERRKTRAELVAAKLRPLVEKAIEQGQYSIDWQAPFRPDPYSNGIGLGTNMQHAPSDNLVDAQHDGLNIVIAELVAVGWERVEARNGELRWQEPPTVVEEPA
jgi:hypothetical protein